MINSFKTHTNEIITGQRLIDVLSLVADDWADLAVKIKEENHYAPHVTEKEKEQYMLDMLNEAEAIKNGKVENFTIWQRVNEKLTGECVAFLPSYRR